MPRVQPKTLSSQERMKLLDELWIMIALLESRDEVKNFFKDLLSETEAVMLGRRIQIAKLLLHGTSYAKIAQELHASEGTIAGIHRWLQGGFGGYEKLMPRLEKELKRRKEAHRKHSEAKTAYSWEWLKRRYPLHFLLVNLMEGTNLRPPKKLRKHR
ncbi:hypothetical protein IID24_03145 [Patescibacteria group bacterium]|nr:hypothetical protein [Patescibacteria group bacterium]